MRWTDGPVYVGGRARTVSAGSGKVAAAWALKAGDRIFPMHADPFVVGRGPEVDLQLSDASVSRRHAAFRFDGRPVVEDLQSLNGTLVNRQPIVGRALLEPGDAIAIGSCQFKLVRPNTSDVLLEAQVTQPIADQGHARGSLAALSPREREIFALFAEGLSQREIASSFSVSVKTVETYRTRIGQKLGIRTRAELIRCALDAGILRSTADN